MKSANVSVESCWPSLFAKLAEKRNLEDLFLNACATGGSPPVAVPPSAAGAGGATSTAVPAVEEKKVRISSPLRFCPESNLHATFEFEFDVTLILLSKFSGSVFAGRSRGRAR